MSDELDNPTTTASEILAEIGREFNERRRQSMSSAWRWKLQAYSAHQAELVPAVMAAENFEKLLMSMEEFCKGSAQQTGKTPNEYLSDWLNGGAPAPTQSQLVDAPTSQTEPIN